MARRTDDIGFGGLKLVQDTDMFCYGIDAVILADFAARNRHSTIMDLGTNNGIIPLILSAITNANHITGAEIQEKAAALAASNVEANGLGQRISIINEDVLNLARPDLHQAFDAVTCNPPYTAKGSGIINDGNALTTARHETTADLDDFIRVAAYLLKDRGALYMVHRPARLVDISWSCRSHGLEPKFMRFVSPREGAKPNLLLVEARKNAGRELKLMDPLNVYKDDGTYTDEIEKIYRRAL